MGLEPFIAAYLNWQRSQCSGNIRPQPSVQQAWASSLNVLSALMDQPRRVASARRDCCLSRRDGHVAGAPQPGLFQPPLPGVPNLHGGGWLSSRSLTPTIQCQPNMRWLRKSLVGRVALDRRRVI